VSNAEEYLSQAKTILSVEFMSSDAHAYHYLYLVGKICSNLTSNFLRAHKGIASSQQQLTHIATTLKSFLTEASLHLQWITKVWFSASNKLM